MALIDPDLLKKNMNDERKKIKMNDHRPLSDTDRKVLNAKLATFDQVEIWIKELADLTDPRIS